MSLALRGKEIEQLLLSEESAQTLASLFDTCRNPMLAAKSLRLELVEEAEGIEGCHLQP